MVGLDPTRGHEQAGRRPALVVSTDAFNLGPARLVVVLPLTSTARRIPSRVHVEPPEVRLPSDILREQIRAVSTDRLIHRAGQVSPGTPARVETALRVLLELYSSSCKGE